MIQVGSVRFHTLKVRTRERDRGGLPLFDFWLDDKPLLNVTRFAVDVDVDSIPRVKLELFAVADMEVEGDVGEDEEE